MTTMPPEITYGHVTGRFIAAWTDGPDGDRLPDPRPLEGLTVKITPKVQVRRLAGASPVLVATMPVTCKVDADGVLIDEQDTPGVWLVTGVYGVTYAHPAVTIPAHDIEVTDAHTEGAPLDLVTAMPPGGPVLTASQYAELSARIDGIVVEAGGVTTVNGQTGAVTLDAADVGAATTAQGALADTAVQPADVTDVIREGDTRLTDARTPTTHTHAYADITNPPTIPGPQTLSLTGSDLTLSGGGGTVTLPSGGGGGFTPTMGSKPGTLVSPAVPSQDSTATATWKVGRVYVVAQPMIPNSLAPITLTGAAISVKTVAAAGSVIRVGLYGSLPDGGFDGATLICEAVIPTDVSGLREAAFTAGAVTLTPGVYWQAIVAQGASASLRAQGADRSLGEVNPDSPDLTIRRDSVTGALPASPSGWSTVADPLSIPRVAWRVAT